MTQYERIAHLEAALTLRNQRRRRLRVAVMFSVCLLVCAGVLLKAMY